MSAETTRFAPSPTGYLHLGHARAAFIAAEEAARTGGQFLLRIEDLDGARCRPAYVDAIFADLAWLGLHPRGPVRVQSAHFDAYRACLARLHAGGLIYPCFCSRADVAAAATAPHREPGSPGADPYGRAIYPGTCRNRANAPARLAAGAPHCWRLDLTRALAALPGPLGYREMGRGWVTARPERFGDSVLGRRDCPASYHLAVSHDDAVQQVTLVTRAEDLRDATDLHVLLQGLLGWPTPRYRHFPLLTDASGRRLAKRDKAATLAQLRQSGVSPATVRSMAMAGLEG